MARALAKLGSLRFSRLEIGRLTVALLLSLFAHLGVWGGYEAGKKFGWWDKLQPHTRLHLAGKKTLPQQPPQNYEPEIFVDVSHAEPEPPPKTKYYSNKNSRAANPDADRDSNQPKLNGKQKDIPKTEDVPQLPKLQPSMPPPQPKVAQPETPKPPVEEPQTPGDLDPIKPKAATTPPKQPTPPERPRTLKEARAQQHQDQLPGQQMKQDGGVRRKMEWSSFDAKATAFGDYDRKIIEAVTQHWYDLLDSQRFAQDRTGKVVLYFKLKFDGSITEMRTLENTVGETLGYVCQEAIEEAAPFEKWPSDMRRQIGANYREITFSFYYY
jgi:outer membrane biosynthesis protein TonB